MDPNTPPQGGDLFSLLLQRQMQGQAPQALPQGAMPTSPPNPTTKVPPAVNRYTTAEAMKNAYANGWSPNPLIVRALGGSR